MSDGVFMLIKLKLQLHPQGITLLLSDADKSNGVRKIAEFGGVSPENLVYVGDTLTDMQGLELVKFPACPSNAHPKVKQLVKSKNGFVSTKPLLAGCLDLLENYVPQVNKILNKEGQKGLYCAVFDFDGCLFDKSVTFLDKEHQPLLQRFNQYIRKCQGPFTEKPLVTINTGGSIDTWKDYIDNWGFPLYRAYGFNPEDINSRFHSSWPPLLFEDGMFSYNPITKKRTEYWTPQQKQSILKLKQLGKATYSQLCEDIELTKSNLSLNDIRDPPKDASFSIDFIGDKPEKLSILHKELKPIFIEQAEKLGIKLEIFE